MSDMTTLPPPPQGRPRATRPLLGAFAHIIEGEQGQPALPWSGAAVRPSAGRSSGGDAAVHGGPGVTVVNSIVTTGHQNTSESFSVKKGAEEFVAERVRDSFYWALTRHLSFIPVARIRSAWVLEGVGGEGWGGSLTLERPTTIGGPPLPPDPQHKHPLCAASAARQHTLWVQNGWPIWN